MVRYWIKDYKYTTVTGEVIIEPNLYVIKDEDIDVFDALHIYAVGTNNYSRYIQIHCGHQPPYITVDCQTFAKLNHSTLYINCKIKKFLFYSSSIYAHYRQRMLFIKSQNYDNITDIVEKLNDYTFPFYINGVEIKSPTSYSDYKNNSLETKLSKLMAYLSIPTCVIEDDPVEEEDDSSLSEVDRLIKENAKLKKMLGLT